MGSKFTPEDQIVKPVNRDDNDVAADNNVATEQENLTPEQSLENLYEKELADIDTAYDTKISNSDTLYQDQIDAAEAWKKEQTKIQNEQTEFAIDQIEQQKAQAEKEYQQEQSAAYVDYKKQTDPYGVNAEQMAAMGMAGTGYSETSKVSMYNQYQYRVAVAKRALGEATVAYDNMIKEAKIQNNSALAQLALDTYKQTSALVLEKLQTRDELLEEKASEKAKLNKKYTEILEAILAEQEERPTIDPIIDPTTDPTINSGTVNEALLDQLKADAWNVMTNRHYDRGTDPTETKYTVDQESVEALGLGSLSARALSDLVNSGKVIDYYDHENHKIKFRWRVSTSTSSGAQRGMGAVTRVNK